MRLKPLRKRSQTLRRDLPNHRKIREECKDKGTVICEFCRERVREFEVHHVDHNYTNDEESNLAIICKDCHVFEHRRDMDFMLRHRNQNLLDELNLNRHRFKIRVEDYVPFPFEVETETPAGSPPNTIFKSHIQYHEHFYKTVPNLVLDTKYLPPSEKLPSSEPKPS